MDQQRKDRPGKANAFVVIPIRDKNLKKELGKVLADLEMRYKSAKFEIRHAFTNLESDNELHVTLIGLHCNKIRLEQISECLQCFQMKLQDEEESLSFELTIQEIDAFVTSHGNIILFARFDKQSTKKIQTLAKQIRDYIYDLIEAQEPPESPRDSDFDFPGMWMDDPTEDVFIPHLTLLNSEPEDKNLRKAIYDKIGNSFDIRDEFGRNRELFKEMKKEYSSVVFGKERVQNLELQSRFQVVETIDLN